MDRDPLNNLEHITIKPLTEAERAQVWLSIKGKLAMIPAESPFSITSLFRSKALAYTFAFLVVLGTVGASDNAVPGSPLYPVDLAVERVESTVAPASRAHHARERVSEFKATLGETQLAAETGIDLRMEKTIAPEANTMMLMVADDAAQEEDGGAPVRELPPNVQANVDATRQALHAIEAEAALTGDMETLAVIQATIAEFEALVSAL